MSDLDLFTRPELIPRTGRFRELDLLDRIYEGKQYDGRPNWWTGKHHNGDDEAPLRERKPCIIYRLPKAATQQVVRFLFGEKRFPKVSFEVSDTKDANFPALSVDDAATLGTWVDSLIEFASVQPHIRAIANRAISCKTAVTVIELDEGEYKFTLPRPQDCAAKFKDGNANKPVEKLVWCYEFDKEVADPAGNPITKRFYFRREWDQANTYVYPDTEIIPGKKVEWPAPSVTSHGLSFCPVIWTRNESEYANGIDGCSLYEGLEEEFEALDMALSRRHQGIIYLGAPQLVETGVEADDGPDASGRRAGPAGFSGDGGEFKVAPKARRVAPDSVWTYEGEKVKVELVETSGKAFEVGTLHVNDIRSRVLETMGVVLTSMADTVSRVTTGADMSARFLALAHAPLIALVQEYRHTWWPKGLKPILSMMMRMAVEAERGNQVVMVPGTSDAVKILTKFSTSDGWVCPQMAAHWGKFFDPSSTEIKTSVEAAVAAKEGKLISHETAVEVTSHDFNVDSVETELEEIEADTEKALAQETLELQRMGVGDGQKQLPGAAKTPQAGGNSGRPKDGKVDPGGTGS